MGGGLSGRSPNHSRGGARGRGKPTMPDDQKRKVTAFTLAPELLLKVESESDRLGLSRSELLNRAVAAYFTETPADQVAEALRLVSVAVGNYLEARPDAPAPPAAPEQYTAASGITWTRGEAFGKVGDPRRGATWTTPGYTLLIQDKAGDFTAILRTDEPKAPQLYQAGGDARRESFEVFELSALSTFSERLADLEKTIARNKSKKVKE